MRHSKIISALLFSTLLVSGQARAAKAICVSEENALCKINCSGNGSADNGGFCEPENTCSGAYCPSYVPPAVFDLLIRVCDVRQEVDDVVYLDCGVLERVCDRAGTCVAIED